MATINEQGNIQACCPDCHGALSTFEWLTKDKVHGAVFVIGSACNTCYRLYRCAGCGGGAMAVVRYTGRAWPGETRELVSFHSETKDKLRLPAALPQALTSEFREAEACVEAGCLRAALGLFRSVLVRALRANGYDVERDLPISRTLQTAAEDGVITEARKRRALRLLGTDIFSTEWCTPPRSDVESLRRLVQQLLEDFYEDRPAVALMLREAGRLKDDGRQLPVPAAHQTGRRFIPTTLQ